MKIVVILSRFPYPLEKGDKLRAYHQLKELAKNNEVILCSLTDTPVKKEWVAAIEAFCQEVHIYPLKKGLLYWNTAKQFFTNKPYQTGYFYQRNIKRSILTLIQSKAPDHIYCQLIRTTEYVKDLHHIPKTLDYMDALSKGMYRRAEIATGIKKRLFHIEGKRLAEYENRIFDYFNHHTIISEQDRALISHPQRNKIAVIENGISADFTDYVCNTAPTYDLVFTGNMNYPPNVECAEFIVNDILPILEKSNPNLTVLLSGANPHARVQALAAHQNVTVSGWVKDIRDSYAAGKIFLAPLFIGTGLQNKLLEAMAMGLPCVTTSLANNALEAKPNESVFIANNAAAFAAIILDLIAHPEKGETVAQNGKNLIQKKYNWSASVEKLITLFKGK